MGELLELELLVTVLLELELLVTVLLEAELLTVELPDGELLEVEDWVDEAKAAFVATVEELLADAEPEPLEISLAPRTPLLLTAAPRLDLM